jgi:pimeloyl-ACP methyl ester carboxylesterase
MAAQVVQLAKPPAQNDHRLRLPAGRMLGYREYGDKHGTPILYFHGSLSCRVDIDFADDICKQRGVHLFALDRPGIGLSDYQPNYSLLDWPDDVAAFAHQVELSKFAVLGWSGGGPYALACGYKIPHLITHLATSGCCGTLDHTGAVEELGLWGDRLLFNMVKLTPWMVSPFLSCYVRLPAALVKAGLISDLTSAGDLAVLRDLQPEKCVDFFYEALRSGADGTREDYRILRSPWGFRPEDITIPVTLFHGEEDELCPVKHAHDLADRIPQARLKMIPGQGHFLLRKNIGLALDTLLAQNEQETQKAI